MRRRVSIRAGVLGSGGAFTTVGGGLLCLSLSHRGLVEKEFSRIFKEMSSGKKES